MRHMLIQSTIGAEQGASSMRAHLAAVGGHDDTCVPQRSHERSKSVKSETILRTAYHRSTILGWRGSVGTHKFTAEVPVVVE
jgi:hypothetical protein